MKTKELATAFIRHCERQGCAANTLAHYQGRLKRFLEEFGNTDVKDIGRDELMEHIHKSSTGLSPSTKRANIVVIERLQKFARKFGHIKRRWIKDGDVQKPRQGYREKYATNEETQALIAEMRVDARLIYRTLRLTGARPGELCGATIAHLIGEPGERMIVLTNHKTARKTGRPREIILSPVAEELVMEAVGDRTEGPIFATARGKHWLRDRLSREFRRCRNKLGVSPEIVLYSARHEAATEIVRTVGIAQAAGLLGHSDIKTTQRYTHLARADLRAAAAASIRDIRPDNGSRGAKESNGLEDSLICRSDEGNEAGRRAA